MINVMINELSLDGQFNNDQDFFNNLVCVVKILNGNSIKEVYKSNILYEREITKEKKLIDYLIINGNPLITKFKSEVAKLMREPHLESVSTTEDLVLLAYLKELAILSFEHNKYNVNVLTTEMDGNQVTINNIFNDESYYNCLLKEGSITTIKYLKLKYPMVKTLKKNNVETFIETNFLDSEKMEVIHYFDQFYNIGLYKDSRFTKKLNKKIYEFRFTLSTKKVIRIFYMLENVNLVFLHIYIKKTQKLPPGELRIAIENSAYEYY